jgi:two-component system CheB/CheR fusion protein
MSKGRPSSTRLKLLGPARSSGPRPGPATASFPVVGVGASAGGLDAFRQLLAHVPANAGLALVLVQHLEPKRPSTLSDALGRATKMKVAQAEEGVRVEPNRVYVIPPGTQMAIERGILRLAPGSDEARRPHLPIDHFLRSLAAERGRQSIGVVLSGTASDGTEGLAAIRAQGGITFAQDPRSARFGEMPQNAIDAGVVDYSLTLPALGDELTRLAAHPYLSRREPVPPTPRGAASLARIFGLVRAAGGVDFSEYKPATFKRRLARRMAVRRAQDIAAYLKLLQEDPGEVRSLHDDLLIHVTSFFRDGESLEELKATALPEVLKRKAAGVPIRAWVVGCSTGEEVYSLAMSLVEFLGDSPSVHPVHIFGSDVSDKAIEHARAGLYSEAAMREVGEERRSRFFVKSERGWRVAKALRELCVFARNDIARDPPFSRLDLVSCRNVLIYFGHALQKRVLESLHHSLNQPGYLLLGSSENVSSAPRLFAPATASGKLFARRPVASTFRLAPRSGDVPFAHGPPAGETADHTRTEGALAQHVDELILARYGPPGVVVSERLEIVQFRGRTGPYLEPPAGEPQTHLLRMARPHLRAPLRIALSQARKTSAPVRKEHVVVDDSGRTCDIVVLPSQDPGPGGERSFVVLFEERASEPAKRPDTKPAGRRRGAARHDPAASLQLEEELASTKESLGSLIEEHDRANDELASANTEFVSVNEELQSMNEELETAKEEIQATNEELTTLNDELNGRNQELQLANADLTNLLETVEMPIVMLDANRRIRRFTPQAGVFLNLTPAAVGKPIGDIALELNAPDLESWVAQTMKTGAMVEAEVQDQAERWHRMRIRPHRALDGRADGTILSLVDIHALKHDVADAEWERDYARNIVEAVQMPLVVIDGQLRVLSANEAFFKAFGISPAETEGRGFFDIGRGGWDTPELRRSLGEVLAEDACFRGLEIERDFPTGRRTMSLSARSVKSRTSTRMILLGIEDVTERIQGERLRAELLVRAERGQNLAEQANEAKDHFLAMLSHELRTPLTSLLLQAELLRSGVIEPAKLKRVSAAVERGANLQLRLVEELLDVSRIVAGKLRLQDKWVDLAPVVAAALEFVKALAEAKSLRIATDVATAIPLFRGDPARLQQVVANLLTNSIKLTPEGGQVGVRLDRVNGTARITVTDTGRGIDPQFLPRIFDRFAQEDGSHTRSHGGLGLGLSIARHIVELHGGTIQAESPGRDLGATFTATLPLRDAVDAPPPDVSGVSDKAEVGVHAVPDAQRLAAVRVLVVDDDDVREDIADLLAREGAEVTTRASVEAGLAAVETFRPDVILCDIAMPGEDGYSFVRRLRALDGARGGDTPAVAFTALAGEREREQCLAAGFQAHLAKPATRDAVLGAVQSVLEPHPPGLPPVSSPPLLKMTVPG